MHGQMPNQPLDPEALRALLSGSRLPKNVFPGIGVYIPAHPSSQNEPCTYFTQQNRKNGQALSCVFNTTDQLCQSSGENQHKGCRAFPAVSPTLALPWTNPVSQRSDGAEGAHAALTPCEGHREACPKSPLLWEAAFTAPGVDISPARTSVGPLLMQEMATLLRVTVKRWEKGEDSSWNRWQTQIYAGGNSA